MSDLSERILASAAFCVRRSAPLQLLVATAEWDGARKHLRLGFFFDCRTDEVDFDVLDLALGEAISDHWFAIESAGAAYVFDKLAVVEALASPARVFAREGQASTLS
jgi:hypothetical protein